MLLELFMGAIMNEKIFSKNLKLNYWFKLTYFSVISIIYKMYISLYFIFY